MLSAATAAVVTSKWSSLHANRPKIAIAETAVVLLASVLNVFIH